MPNIGCRAGNCMLKVLQTSPDIEFDKKSKVKGDDHAPLPICIVSVGFRHCVATLLCQNLQI
jgi:hypothetical protein